MPAAKTASVKKVVGKPAAKTAKVIGTDKSAKNAASTASSQQKATQGR
jgi:hypothetical protein